MVLGIILVIVAVFIILPVIIGIVSSKMDARKKKEAEDNKKKQMSTMLRTGFTPAQSLLSGGEYSAHLSKIDENISEINTSCLNKREECLNRYNKLTAEAEKIQKNICNALDELSLKVQSGNATIDKLLELYKTVQTIIDEPHFQGALAQCKEENIAEVAEIVKMNEERQKLREKASVQMEAMNELADAQNSVARDAWKYKYCEQVYNALVAMKNDPNYVYRQKTLSKIERFTQRSFYCYLQDNLSIKMGRDGNEFAIWSTKGEYSDVYPIDDMWYYTITEKKYTFDFSSSTYNKSPSRLGIAIDEAIWGTAAATAKAIEKQQKQQTADVRSFVDRKAEIFFNNPKISKITISIDSGIDALKRIFPDKDESVVFLNQSNNSQPQKVQEVPSQQTAQANNIEMLKKYKELLDMGAITQEEYDAKKAELL